MENKKEDKKSTSVYVCPRCKSKDVAKVHGLGNLFGLISKWKCNKCGHSERVFPQVGKSSKPALKPMKK